MRLLKTHNFRIRALKRQTRTLVEIPVWDSSTLANRRLDAGERWKEEWIIWSTRDARLSRAGSRASPQSPTSTEVERFFHSSAEERATFLCFYGFRFVTVWIGNQLRPSRQNKTSPIFRSSRIVAATRMSAANNATEKLVADSPWLSFVDRMQCIHSVQVNRKSRTYKVKWEKKEERKIAARHIYGS